MAGDDALILGLHAEHLANAGGDEAMARAVCAPAANVVVLIIFVGNGVHVGVLGHRLVERRVEHEHLRQFGQHFLHGHVAFEVCVRVERGEIHVLFPFFQHGIGHDLALREASARHDAVACGRDFVEALDCAVLGREERVEHEFDAFRMGGAGVFDDFRFAVDFCFQERAFQPNLFNAACGEHAAVVHFVELVLDGAAAAVDD